MSQSVLQVGKGFAYLTDPNAATTEQQKLAFALFNGGTISWKSKQEFLSGPNQIAMYAANIEQEITGELKFYGLDTAILVAAMLRQFKGGALALSKLLQLDDPKTHTTNTFTLTACESVLEVRTPVALGTIPAGGKLRRVAASATPATGEYKVSGEGTATATVTIATADGTTVGTNAFLVNWLKKATTDTQKLSLQNAIAQQAMYFQIEVAGKMDGNDVVGNFVRVVATELPNLFDGSDKFAERSMKVRILATPDSGVIGDITFSGNSAA
jgi:hypothetical protein